MAIHPSNLWAPFRQTKLTALSVCPVWLSGCLHPWLAQGVFYFQCACKAASGAHDAGCSWTDVAVPSLLRPPLPLSPLFPLPVPSSQNESGTAVTADVIATRHHWCYDNSKSSLSLIHRSILGCWWVFQIMHHNTLRLQPFSPCSLCGKENICFIFQNPVILFTKQRGWKQDYFLSKPKMRWSLHLSCYWSWLRNADVNVTVVDLIGFVQ